jgi:hypothetical protein
MQTKASAEAEQPQSPSAAAFYIGTLAAELARIARRHDLDALGYILDMARLEAEQIVKGTAPPGNPPLQDLDGSFGRATRSRR